MGIVHPFRRDLDEEYVPPKWTAEHVCRRMIDAQKTLISQPAANIRPGQHKTIWPEYQSDWADLVGRVGHEEEIDLKVDFEAWETEARATPEQISRMNRALAWPGRFLRGWERQSRAATHWAAGKAQARSMRAIARRFDLKETTFRRQAFRGFELIALGLNRAGEAVW